MLHNTVNPAYIHLTLLRIYKSTVLTTKQIQALAIYSENTTWMWTVVFRLIRWCHLQRICNVIFNAECINFKDLNVLELTCSQARMDCFLRPALISFSRPLPSPMRLTGRPCAVSPLMVTDAGEVHTRLSDVESSVLRLSALALLSSLLRRASTPLTRGYVTCGISFTSPVRTAVSVRMSCSRCVQLCVFKERSTSISAKTSLSLLEEPLHSQLIFSPLALQVPCFFN